MNHGDYVTHRQQTREVLEARGFGWKETARPSQILEAPNNIGLSAVRFHLYLGDYKFRRLLWWLSDNRTKGPFTESDLSQGIGCKGDTFSAYLDALRLDGIAINEENRWCLNQQLGVSSYGPTLEWYTAVKFINDLHWHAAQGVVLDDTPLCESDPYNDYDVIAVHGSDIALVECKAGRQIDDGQIKAFRARHNFLAPDFSLLLWDTDKPVKTLADRVTRIADGGEPEEINTTTGGSASVKERLFWIPTRTYVGNSLPDAADGILRALQLCVRHFYTSVRGLTNVVGLRSFGRYQDVQEAAT